MAEEGGWEVGRDCSSTAWKSEQRWIRGALCREMSKHLSLLYLGTTRLSFAQEICDVGKEKRDTLN